MNTALATLILTVLAPLGFQAVAQDFQPPRPPPMDPNADFDDMDQELMEMGDEGFNPPPPPPPTGGAPNSGGPPPMGSPGGAGFDRFGGGTPVGGGNFGQATAAKLKFKVVEGEFWEKGKKRTRGDRSK
jgi:hypothetical protein